MCVACGAREVRKSDAASASSKGDEKGRTACCWRSAVASPKLLSEQSSSTEKEMRGKAGSRNCPLTATREATRSHHDAHSAAVGIPLLGPGGMARIPVRWAEPEPPASPLPSDPPVPLRERCATTLRQRSAGLHLGERFPRRAAQTPTQHDGPRTAA